MQAHHRLHRTGVAVVSCGHEGHHKHRVHVAIAAIWLRLRHHLLHHLGLHELRHEVRSIAVVAWLLDGHVDGLSLVAVAVSVAGIVLAPCWPVFSVVVVHVVAIGIGKKLEPPCLVGQRYTADLSRSETDEGDGVFNLHCLHPCGLERKP